MNKSGGKFCEYLKTCKEKENLRQTRRHSKPFSISSLDWSCQSTTFYVGTSVKKVRNLNSTKISSVAQDAQQRRKWRLYIDMSFRLAIR